MAKTIPLTRGHVAVVDDEDYAVYGHLKWFAKQKPGESPYAARTVRGRTVLMHREILGLTDPRDLADHKNGNTLDNRRSNLRRTDKQGNSANGPTWARSGYRGVWQSGGRWRAGIKVRGKTLSLGSFATPELAAAAYNTAAVEHFGEMARPNLINRRAGEAADPSTDQQ